MGFSNFGEGIKVIDPYTGELRASTKKDMGDIARLVDALPDVDVFEMAVVRGDQPPATTSLHNHEAALTNQTKPISGGPLDGRAVHTTVEMLTAVQGSPEAVRERPMMIMGTCPVSPLKLVKRFCEIVIEAARVGLPSCVLSMAMAGGSSPVTRAGTLVTHNAEVLAGIVPPSHGARQQGAVRLVDDGHGPSPGDRVRRVTGVRDRVSARRRSAGAAVPAAELHRRCVGGQQAQ